MLMRVRRRQPARQDGQPVGIVEVNGDRCCYPGSDDQLITDYQVTIIGYEKKTSFTSLLASSNIMDTNIACYEMFCVTSVLC